MQEKMLRTLSFEITSLNDDDHSFVAIASDETVDRHGEVVEQSSWDLANFKANPVVPWGHDYFSPPVAKATEIEVVDGKLMFRPKFAVDEYPFAQTIYNLYKGGYLRAFSVGFIPKEMDGNRFKECELLEISAVTVPSNPAALALAYKEGVINEKEVSSLVKSMKSSIKALTTQKNNEDTNHKEIDMEEIQKLQSTVESLVALVESVVEGVGEIKTLVATKAVEPDPAPEVEPEVPAKSEEEVPSDSAEKSDEEVLSAEDAQKIIDETVTAALAAARGKVE